MDELVEEAFRQIRKNYGTRKIKEELKKMVLFLVAVKLEKS